MLSIGFPELALGAELVIEVHVRRFEEGVFHPVYGHGIPGFGKQSIIHDEVIFQWLIKGITFRGERAGGISIFSMDRFVFDRFIFYRHSSYHPFFCGINAGPFSAFI